MDTELLTCLLKFIEYFPDYLSAIVAYAFLDNLKQLYVKLWKTWSN